MDHVTKSTKTNFYYNNKNIKHPWSFCVIDLQLIEEGPVTLH